ncbi:MAG TPA: hypothetical protein VFB14_13635 [Bryobacteraceae bacterium]|jgi:cytochrome bd-type quinol oxidase subunit 2|nr:hypothetical protein [Bryobacteraceae bacterium]
MTERNGANEGRRHGDHGTTVASFAAIASVLAASSCCLPILPFLLAAGFASGSAFFSASRAYLLGASVLLIVYGFYQAWRAKKCQRPSVMATALLWLSTVFVLISILFPQMMPNAFANVLAQ